MSRYDAVLFDNDGVLVEHPSTDVLRTAAESAFRAVGVDEFDPDHVEAVMGGTTLDLLQDVCGVYGVDPAAFWTARDRHTIRGQRREFREGDRCRYDDVDVLDRLPHSRGVVSSNQHATVEFVLEFFDLGADSALYVGDSESDVVAAHRAGLDSAFVRRDHCEGDPLSIEPTYEVEDLWGVAEIAGEP